MVQFVLPTLDISDLHPENNVDVMPGDNNIFVDQPFQGKIQYTECVLLRHFLSHIYIYMYLAAW